MFHPNRMQENTTLYRIALSSVGGAITAILGLLVGAVWALAVDVDVPLLALVLGASVSSWALSASS